MRYACEAHPHTRGDDIDWVARGADGDGSPPHAWGRPDDQHLAMHTGGLTPTRVGTTHDLG